MLQNFQPTNKEVLNVPKEASLEMECLSILPYPQARLHMQRPKYSGISSSGTCATMGASLSRVKTPQLHVLVAIWIYSFLWFS